MPESEFVTISRASILLEAPERTVRRVAAKLADTDRQLADKGARLVRLSALALQMGKPLPVDEVADTHGGLADTGNQNGRQLADTSEGLADTKESVADSGGHSESALVDQLRQENAFLRSALEKEQANSAAALALARESEQRAAQALLIAGRATGQIASAGYSSGDSSPVQGAGEGIVPSDTVEAQKRPFWAFWKRG